MKTKIKQTIYIENDYDDNNYQNKKNNNSYYRNNNKNKNRFNNFQKAYLPNVTNLIKNDVEEISIKNWINNLNKPIYFKLLFRMTRDGTTALNFHLNCDNKGKTLILIETNDDLRIGAYTSLQWNMDGIKKYGENIWLFTFQKDLYRIPLMTPNKTGSIICDMNNGPSFDEFFVIKNNDLTKGYIESE